MRRLRFNAAISLDGFLARPDGTFDWIVEDSSIDFPSLFAQFDTLLMGRKTYDVLRREPPGGPTAGMKKYVVSATMDPADDPAVTIIRANVADAVSALKKGTGRDIWLFGGGVLFRSLLDARLVDTVELAVMPVMIGEGVPLLPAGKPTPPLRLERSTDLPSGIVMLSYTVDL